jgi:hypothetical protein
MDVETYPSAKESIQRLIQSSWSMCQTVHIGPRAKTLWRVKGTNGENVIRAHGVTQAQAWHRAVEAAAACGMLKGWPRPAMDESE